MQISLFGGVRAATDAGEPLDVGPARCQALLAALALSAGSAVPVPRLVDQVWGERPPRTAEKTLQWYVAQLRKALGADAIERTGAAYRLAVPADTVDVGRFCRHLDAGDVDAALREWTGAPLAGLDCPGLAPAVDGLVERWLDATERSLARRVDTDPGGAVGPLTELSAQHPFREGLWALLMTALQRSGRQADALAAFRTARDHLVEELGVEPGARLRELEALVLSGDDAGVQPRPGPGRAAPPAVGGGGVSAVDDVPPAVGTGGLPAAPGRLIGRDAELAAVAAALAASRVVTVVGPGGIGKTCLALAAARAAVGGAAVFVDLAQVAASAEVPRAVADALGVREQAGRTLTETVVAALQALPALLVVDNCEHVVDGAAELVEAVAARCPQVRVLATSREPLAAGGEQLVTLGPLDAAASMELFTERARAAAAAIDVAADRDDVAELCRRLDGVPLAIELAAARMRALTPAELLARVDDSLRLLTGGRRSSAGRQRTLRATIRWSYDLLSEPERALLRRLSVFAGPFTLPATEAVAGDVDARGGPVPVDDLLGRLVERSMVLAETGPARRGVRAGRRFRLLETVRQFARGQLVAEGAADAAAARHARWCRDEAGEIGALLSGPAEADGVARLAELWPNLRAAVGWACTGGDRNLALGLVRPVATEIALRGRQEVGDWVERVVALAPDDGEVVAWALLWASQRYVQSGDRGAYARFAGRVGEPDHPLARYARAYADGQADDLAASAPAAVAAAAQDSPFVADLLELSTAGILLGAGRFAAVEASVGALVERQRTAGRPTLLHWALSALAYSASLQGDLARADRLNDEAADADVPAGTLSANKPIQARGAFRRGEQRRGLRILRDSIDEVLATGNVVAASVVAVEFVNMMAALGRLDDAARLTAYLESANAFAARAATTLVSDAARSAAADAARSAAADGAGRQSPPADDREALEAMRAVLDALV